MNESQETQPKSETGLPLGAAPCSAIFAEWCKVRGVWPRLTHEEIWHTAWNAAIETALLTTPGGSICDPQAVADDIRALMSPNDPVMRNYAPELGEVLEQLDRDGTRVSPPRALRENVSWGHLEGKNL